MVKVKANFDGKQVEIELTKDEIEYFRSKMKGKHHKHLRSWITKEIAVHSTHSHDNNFGGVF
jgi:hypothetical protein